MKKDIKEFVLPKKEVIGSGDPIEACSRLILPKGVKAIEDFAFFGQGFEEVVLPAGLEFIGSCAFQECRSLKSVILPKSLKKIGEYAFEYCTALKSVRFSGKRPAIIGDGVFHGCVSLEKADLPKKVEVFGSELALSGAFEGCCCLKKIALPKGFKFISPGTFSGCTSLKKINFPETLIGIGEEALAYTALKEIVLPEGVDSFYGVATGCKSLRRIVLPSTVRSLSYMVFGGLPALREVTLPRHFEPDLALYANEETRSRVRFTFL